MLHQFATNAMTHLKILISVIRTFIKKSADHVIDYYYTLPSTVAQMAKNVESPREFHKSLMFNHAIE